MAKTAAKKRKKKTTRKKTDDVKNSEDAPAEEVETAVATAEENGSGKASGKTEAKAGGNGNGNGADKKEPTEEESIHAKYERIKRGNLHITDLQNLEVTELHKMAKKEGIGDYMGMTKQQLIFRILKERIRQEGLMYGEGVLEILPDGFGFPAES